MSDFSPKGRNKRNSVVALNVTVSQELITTPRMKDNGQLNSYLSDGRKGLSQFGKTANNMRNHLANVLTPTHELAQNPLTPHADEDYDAMLIANMMGNGLMNVRENPDETNPDAPPKKVKYQMMPGDEIVNIYINKEGKRRKVIKRIVRETVKLTVDQVAEIREAFKLFDKDDSGYIDTEELKDAMRALGFIVDKKRVKDLMEQADKDGSGQIDQEEFKALMARFIVQRKPQDELKNAFKMYDDDENGTISFENLEKVAAELEEDISDYELKMMLQVGDRNKHGGEQVDFEDFMYIMEQANLF